MKLRYILLSAPLVAMSLPALAQDMTIDTDGDENYSYTELLAVMPDMPTDAFSVMDENDDGLITLDEMQSSMNKHYEERQAKADAEHAQRLESLSDRFANMDSDGNGAVTQQEARMAAFNRMDENKDGVISKDEIKPPKGRGHRGDNKSHNRDSK